MIKILHDNLHDNLFFYEGKIAYTRYRLSDRVN